MNAHVLSRRAFSARLASCAAALAIFRLDPPAAPGDGISHTAEAIHQEIAFKAAPARIYAVLLDDQQFSKATGSLPAKIDPAVGGAFALFSDQIKGRQLELVPNARIVQAWRAEDWDPGAYSIARFVLSPQGSGTKLVFDHTGFPTGQAEHLAAGWKSHYWAGLQKLT